LSFFGDHLVLNSLFKIEDDIDKLNLPYLFDLSIFSQISNDSLIEHIERVGIVFYNKIPKAL